MDRLSLAATEAKTVLIVGSVAFDNIVTPHATGERILGGSASYASLASAPTRASTPTAPPRRWSSR